MALDELSFHLEEDDGDGLLHRGDHVVCPVGPLCEEGELAQGDAVGALEHLKGVVTDIRPYDGGDASLRACCRPHPTDVMVAPLEVQGVVLHEAIHDLVRVCPPVEDVPYEVEVIHGEALDEGCQRADEVVGGARAYDGADDLLVVLVATRLAACRCVQQLVDDVGVSDRHGPTHL